MSQTFDSLGLRPELLATLNTLGYHQPTPIQEQAIPALLNGRDVIGQAQTGTGKTAAFTLPILQHIQGDDLQVLILTPTRELAIQVSEAVYRYGTQLGVRVLPIYGGQSYDRQERRLQKGVQVVVGTPGRTLDLMRRRSLKLNNVRFVIMDEADEMLKMGFIEDVESILGATDAKNRQTALFSATFSPELRKLAQNYMQTPLHITVETEDVTSENTDQYYYVVEHKDKIPALCRLLETVNRQNVLIFTRTRANAAELAEQLVILGYAAIAIHGDLAQNERERILRRFREGQTTILVATDVVGRGVDISDISHVINFDIPPLPIEYVHRIGRTGRAGRSGIAMTIITPKERRTLQRIEQFIDRPIKKAKLPTIEEVITARNTHFMAHLVGQIEQTTQTGVVLDELLAMGYPPEQIAAAAIQLLRNQEAATALEDIRLIDERSEAPRKRRSDPNGRTERPGTHENGGGRGKKSPRSHEPGMVRLRIDIGRSAGIKPGDVVYGVASSANIPGKVIGAIDIQQDETYLDVPEAYVEDALKKLKRGRIKGHPVKLVRA